jgi:hypothetical protein
LELFTFLGNKSIVILNNITTLLQNIHQNQSRILAIEPKRAKQTREGNLLGSKSKFQKEMNVAITFNLRTYFQEYDRVIFPKALIDILEVLSIDNN